MKLDESCPLRSLKVISLYWNYVSVSLDFLREMNVHGDVFVEVNFYHWGNDDKYERTEVDWAITMLISYFNNRESFTWLSKHSRNKQTRIYCTGRVHHSEPYGNKFLHSFLPPGFVVYPIYCSEPHVIRLKLPSKQYWPDKMNPTSIKPFINHWIQTARGPDGQLTI